MNDSGLGRLRKLIAERYDQLRTQVANRLGSSSDMAGDALHEAYLRLATREDLDQIKHPQAYLINSAVNATIDRIRSDARLVGEAEVDSLFELVQDEPGPDRVASGRNDMERMLAVLERLPPRQCALLVDYRVHGVGTDELAKRWGISRVLVRREIQAAHRTCLRELAWTGAADD
ncbi:sigma-70 family RNA polymerase sigma factor [Bordetella petrii]|nr:sigma-70 family RNA polymerase sigma factor [Bordetella petrii]